MSPEQIDRVIAAVRTEIDRRFAEHAAAASSRLREDGPAITEGLFEAIKGFVVRNVSPLAKRVDELERR